MKKADDDKPIIEESGKGLRVSVVPVNGVRDLEIDDEAKVSLDDKGMSFVPT